MTRAGQPASHNFLRRLGAVRDVLAREARMVAGADHTILWLTAVTAAMFEEFLSGHVARVNFGRFAQFLRNTERGCDTEPLGSAFPAVTSGGIDQLHHARADSCGGFLGHRTIGSVRA